MPEYNLKIVVSALDKASGNLKGVSKEVEGLGNVAEKAGELLTYGFALAVAKGTFELAKLGAQSLRTRRAFDAISGGASDAEENLTAMRNATRGAISDVEAMAAANKLMQMGLANNADELEQVAGMAVKLGTAMGRDAAASIEEFALLLANQSIPRLDTFGISAGRVRKRILELQRANEGMTREQAFMTATMEEGEKAMTRLGDDSEDLAINFEKAEAATKNLKTALSEGLAKSLEGEILLLGQFSEMLSENAAIAEGLGETFVMMLNPLLSFVHIIHDFRGIIHGTSEGLDSTTESLQGMADYSERAASGLRSVGDAGPNAASGIKEAGDAAADAAGYFNGLVDSAGRLGGAFASGAPNAEDVYKTLLETEAAAGLSAEQIEKMAVAMGITDATSAQLQTQMYTLVDAWQNGLASMEELAAMTERLDAASGYLEEATRLEEEGEYAAAGAMRDKADAITENLEPAMEDYRTQIGEMGDPVTELTGMINTNAAAARTAAAGYYSAAHALEIYRSEASKGLPAASVPGTYTPQGIPGRQGGGPVSAGMPYMVGERGPELFVPRQSGNVTNNFNQVVNTSAGASGVIYGFDLMRAMVGA